MSANLSTSKRKTKNAETIAGAPGQRTWSSPPSALPIADPFSSLPHHAVPEAVPSGDGGGTNSSDMLLTQCRSCVGAGYRFDLNI